MEEGLSVGDAPPDLELILGGSAFQAGIREDCCAGACCRAFTNCSWLQVRGNRIQLNPTAISKAEALATAYCRG